MLWHYLAGNGVEVEVDTELVFSKDPILKIFVFNKIVKDLQCGKPAGRFVVTQDDFGNSEWRYTFGCINVDWEKIGNLVILSINDLYKWHPNEFRETQCVHYAMERAKTYGAQEFHYKGTKIYINITDLNINKGVCELILKT